MPGCPICGSAENHVHAGSEAAMERVGPLGRGARLALGIAFLGALGFSLGFSGPYGTSPDLIVKAFLGFLGVSLVLAAAVGQPGCEVTAIPNLVLRTNRSLWCCLFSPIDALEARLRRHG